MKIPPLPPLLVLLLCLAGTLLAQEKASSSVQKGITGLIAPSDTISVRVYRESDLDTSGPLGKDGSLSVPLIGDVKVLGLTTSQAALLIEAKLRDGYLVKPEVRVMITGRVSKTVSVNGEVRNPGVFILPHDRQLRISEVLAMAGGPTDIANEKKITVKRQNSKTLKRVNLRAILAGKSADFTLVAGDVINVPEGWF